MNSQIGWCYTTYWEYESFGMRFLSHKAISRVRRGEGKGRERRREEVNNIAYPLAPSPPPAHPSPSSIHKPQVATRVTLNTCHYLLFLFLYAWCLREVTIAVGRAHSVGLQIIVIAAITKFFGFRKYQSCEKRASISCLQNVVLWVGLINRHPPWRCTRQTS